jgi:hypothetical protein
MVGRLEVSDLEAEVLRAEILLCAERHWEGDPTQGVGHLLRNASDLSWLSGGDFNEILHDSEQIGGLDHAKWQMEGLGMLLNSVASLIWVILAFLILGTTRGME